jgi:type IV secretion system protein VirB9
MKKDSLNEEKEKALAADAALTDYSLDSLLSADHRIKTLVYDEADVYTITTKYGYQTNIVFERGEGIETISVGDRSMWQIIPSANRLFIRPMEENVTTNMTVLTNRRSYQFDLKSLGPEKSGSNIYVAKFSYQENEPTPQPTWRPAPALPVIAAPAPVITAPAPVVTRMATPVATIAPTPVVTDLPAVSGTSGPGITQPVRPNYSYTYSGPDELAPQQVYDDGRTTFVKFRAPHPPFPKAYAVDDTGREEPVPYTVKSDMMVLDVVLGTLLLKSPQGTVTVYNEMLNPK